MITVTDKFKSIYISDELVCFSVTLDQAKALNKLIKERYSSNPSVGMKEAAKDRCALELYLFIQSVGGLQKNYVKYDYDQKDRNRIKYLVCPVEKKNKFMNELHNISEENFLDPGKTLAG